MAVSVETKSHEGSLGVLRQILRNLDLVVLAIALVPALLLGAPVLGCLLGAAGWVLQRVVAATDRRWTSKVTSPVKRLGVDLFEAFGRIWLLAGVIIVAYLAGGRHNGLAAALVILGCYSVAFAMRLISGPPSQKSRSASTSSSSSSSSSVSRDSRDPRSVNP